MQKFTLKQLILAIVLVSGFTTGVQATVYTFDLALSGQEEVPPNPSTAMGNLTGTYNSATNVLDFNLIFNGLSGTTTIAHFHHAGPGMNGPAQIQLLGFPLGVNSGNYADAYILTPEQESQLLSGLWYINIHTTEYPGGEIRGQLIGESNAADIPLTNGALLFGGLLIVTWTFFMIRRRS